MTLALLQQPQPAACRRRRLLLCGQTAMRSQLPRGRLRSDHLVTSATTLYNRLQHEQHGSRGSAFFSLKAPSLRAQQRQRRAEAAAHICNATALRPQREAQVAEPAQLQGGGIAAAGAAAAVKPPRQTATVPDERRDQRNRERELRCPLAALTR